MGAVITNYPPGTILQACVASLGADWVGFALLLGVAAVTTAESRNRWFAAIVALSIAVVLFPYGTNLVTDLLSVTAPTEATAWEVELVVGTPLRALGVIGVAWRRVYKSLDQRPAPWRWRLGLVAGIGSLLLAANYATMFSPTDGLHVERPPRRRCCSDLHGSVGV